MGDILSALIAGLLANLLFPAVDRIFRRWRQVPAEPEAPKYSQRLGELTETLRSSSREVDNVLAELAAVAEEREAAVKGLENHLASLSQREQELQTRIDQLQNVPLPVAEHFAKLAAAGEKRSAMRDYVLFALGVFVSTAISIVFFILQKN